MSVRRLAEIQPESFAFSNENEQWANKQIAKYPEGRQASAVLSLLWRAQKQNDYWLPKPAIEEVARMLGMPYIRVLEVATFYTMFNLAPVGRFFIQMCGTTPCVLAGSDAIKQVLTERIGPQRTVTADGTFSWLEVECLGACCNAPMVQINDDYYEDLTPENLNKLLDDLAAGRPVTLGSQVGRKTSEPVGGLTSLTSLYGIDGFHGPESGIHHPTVNGESPPHSGQSYDERTTGPAPTHDAATRRTERSAHSIATPDQTVDTGTRRTDAAVSLDGHNREKMAQAEAMRAPADAPSVPPGHEPKAKD
jgi:NADH-quinone oxidoreductase subunit E